MIVSDTHKFIFFHNPKCGGSSITHAIAPYANLGPKVHGSGHGWHLVYHWGHIHSTVALDIATHCKDPAWMKYYWFAFVRNPFDLVISAWKKAQEIYRNPNPTWKNRFERNGVKYGMENISLLEYLNNELGNQRLIHIKRSQYDMLILHAPKKLDKIGRFERMHEDWKEIADHLGIDAELPHRNKSEREGGYRQHYDDTTRKIVEEFYARDLKEFNYSF